MAISPTVRGKVLAKKLRELRVESGYTQTEAARGLGWKQSKVSRIEAQEQYLSVADALALSEYYGVHPAERDCFVGLAKDARKKGWWQSYGDLIPEWFDTFVGMESEASTVFTYESEFVPGLLQTEEYARATTRATVIGASEEEVERSVELRMRRQERLSGPEKITLWTTMNEAVLFRPVGGHSVLRDQLDHMVNLAAEASITVRVMPLTAGGHPALGPFVYLSYPDEWHPDVVYLETQAGAQWVEEAPQVRKFGVVVEHLRAHALSPGDSIELLKKRIGELDGQLR